MSDIKMGELPIMVRLELEDLGDDYHAIPKHLNTMQARIDELEKVILEVLDEHGDLADGDVCTLIKLKRVMGL